MTLSLTLSTYTKSWNILEKYITVTNPRFPTHNRTFANYIAIIPILLISEFELLFRKKPKDHLFLRKWTFTKRKKIANVYFKIYL